MTYVKSWEEFEKAGERLYLQNPLKARYTMKYIHKDGQLYLKLTDDVEGPSTVKISHTQANDDSEGLNKAMKYGNHDLCQVLWIEF